MAHLIFQLFCKLVKVRRDPSYYLIVVISKTLKNIPVLFTTNNFSTYLGQFRRHEQKIRLNIIHESR